MTLGWRCQLLSTRAPQKSICLLSLCFVIFILISAPHRDLWIITDLLWRRLNCRQTQTEWRGRGLEACKETLWEETQLVSKCVGCYVDLIRDFCRVTHRVLPLRWSLLGVTVMRKWLSFSLKNNISHISEVISVVNILSQFPRVHGVFKYYVIQSSKIFTLITNRTATSQKRRGIVGILTKDKSVILWFKSVDWKLHFC